MKDAYGIMCPGCHGQRIEATCAGYLGNVDRNKAWCHECSWVGILEHCLTYPENKTKRFLEYEKDFSLVDQEHADAVMGSKYRVKGKCKCGRDLMVVSGCAVWCSAGRSSHCGDWLERP